MWVEKDQYQQIGSALRRGKKNVVRRLLDRLFYEHDLLVMRKKECPRCHKPLIRKALPYAEVLVDACPDQHGIWLNTEVFQKLKGSLHEGIGSSLFWRLRLAMPSSGLWLLGLFVITALVLVAKTVDSYYGGAFKGIQPGEISRSHWPWREEFRIQQFFKNAGDELQPEQAAYFQMLFPLLHQAVSHKANMADVLKTNRPSHELEALYRFYEEKQYIILRALRQMDVPETLSNFHDYLIRALQSQIAYFLVTVNSRLAREESPVASSKGREDLQRSNGAIIAAWLIFRSTYPHLPKEAYLVLHDILQRLMLS